MLAPDDSGLPGSLKEVLTGPHPAVSGPLPATRHQRLARLAEGSCNGLHPSHLHLFVLTPQVSCFLQVSIHIYIYHSCKPLTSSVSLSYPHHSSRSLFTLFHTTSSIPSGFSLSLAHFQTTLCQGVLGGWAVSHTSVVALRPVVDLSYL